jgi:DNA (cytosine-5)-methyltransferase 1
MKSRLKQSPSARTARPSAHRKVYRAVDLFCGAGGVSTAVLQAAKRRRKRVELIAVNHWPTAIDSHSLNHPHVRHICESVESLWPPRVVPGRYLDLLCASCECTFHSLAAGARACSEQSRTQPWQIIRWATDITIQNIFMENVKEFVKWGPLYPCTCGAEARWADKLARQRGKSKDSGTLTPPVLAHREGSKCLHPIPEREGEYFDAFLIALRGLGYQVEWRIQNAADFGDPTDRLRFILLARLGKQPVWPAQTHAKAEDINGRKLLPHLSARDHVIDWSLKGKSIFNRKKPLSANTLRRIEAGLQKFGGPNAQPFLIMLRGTSHGHVNSSAKSVRDPLDAVTAGGNHHALCEPFVLHTTHQAVKNGDHARRTHSTRKPLPCVTGASRGEMALATPICTPHSALRTPTALLIGQQTPAAARPVSKPTPTIATRGAIALAQPAFILPQRTTGTPRSTKKPLPTITTDGGPALVESIVVQTDQTGFGKPSSSVRSVRSPLRTVVTKQNQALVDFAFVGKYYGTGTAVSVDEPLDTVTTKDRFFLVEPKTQRKLAELDILFRMLQPHELSAAMSFPKHYIFTGNKEDQVKQIGNAVPVALAQAHIDFVFK